MTLIVLGLTILDVFISGPDLLRLEECLAGIFESGINSDEKVNGNWRPKSFGMDDLT